MWRISEICPAVDRQPLLLRGCREINVWQFQNQISRTPLTKFAYPVSSDLDCCRCGVACKSSVIVFFPIMQASNSSPSILWPASSLIEMFTNPVSYISRAFLTASCTSSVVSATGPMARPKVSPVTMYAIEHTAPNLPRRPRTTKSLDRVSARLYSIREAL